jgi:serine/threonine protein phosphatase PrpC
MEDAHSAVLDMAPDSDRRLAWFAVFDGHGGTASWHFGQSLV